MISVSIIVPSFNRPESILRTVDSILVQNVNFTFEIIIGDDASFEQTQKLIRNIQEKYSHIVNLLNNNLNIGLGANWAYCVKACRGKYIANCDDDDYWHNPNKLQLQFDYMEAHPEIGVLHTYYRTHDRTSGKIREHQAFINDNDKSTQRALFEGDFKICNATMMYRKELIDKHVNLDDYINHRFTLQDWNTWVILAKYTKFHCLPVSTATFGVETVSITRPDSYEKISARMAKEKECYEYVCSLFPDDLLFNSSDYDKYINKVLLNFAINSRDYNKAKELTFKFSNINKLLVSSKLIFNLYVFLKKIKKKLN